MSNIFKWLTAIAAVFLLVGFAPQGVHASASMGGNQQGQSEQTYEQQNQYDGFDAFLHKLFEKWGYTGYQDTVDKPKPEQPEQPETEEQPDEEQQTEQPTPAPAPQPEAEQQEQPEQPSENVSSELNQYEQQVVTLTNQEREKHGLQALKIDYELSRVSREKSRDIQANNYFDHNSPTYGSPFDMMEAYGIDYRSAGENIAKGQRSPEEVVNAWMNSEGHRANILNGSFTHIGVGYVEQGNVWTQQFIGK